MSYLIRINNSEYTGQHPKSVVVQRPKHAGDRSLSNKPVGARGYPYAILRWDRISVDDLQWFESFLGSGDLSVTLTDLALPDRRTSGSVTHDSTVYDKHSEWTSAELERPNLPDDARDVEYVDGTRWIDSPIEIRIVNIGK